MTELRDVSAPVWRLHEAARHLWNATFLPYGVDAPAADRFSAVVQQLFAAIVAEPLGLRGARLSHESELRPTSIAELRVQPVAAGVPIHINRTDPPGADWDEEVSNIPTPDTAALEFVGFFDFDRIGRRDLQYVRVRITSFLGAERLAGRHALLHAGHVRFVMPVQPS